MNSELMEQEFKRLRKRLDNVTSSLLVLRDYKQTTDKFSQKKDQGTHNIKCKWVCDALKNEGKRQECMKACEIPKVNLEENDLMEKTFPIDWQRLRDDSELRKNFELLQNPHNDTLPDTKIEVFTMPIAVQAIPEESWNINVNRLDDQQLKDLFVIWRERRDDYPKSAKAELKSKIERNIHPQRLATIAKMLSANE